MILVFGATGKVGSQVMARLVGARVPVRAFVRELAKGAQWAKAGAELAQGDANDAGAVARALSGVDAVFLLSQANGEQESGIVEQAVRAGVKRVVKLSTMSAGLDAPFPMARLHAAVEDKLRESGLGWTILRPGMFAQNLLQFADAVRTGGAITGAYGEGKVAPIDVRDIAEVAIAALTQPGHDGAVYTLTGPEALTFAQMARKLTAAAGREIAYRDVSIETLRQVMTVQLEKAGVPLRILDELTARQKHIAAGNGAHVSADVEKVLGRKARSFDEFARDHAAVFQS